MPAIASTECFDKDELAKKLASSPKIGDINYIKEVSTTEAYTHSQAAWNERVFAQRVFCGDLKNSCLRFWSKTKYPKRACRSGSRR